MNLLQEIVTRNAGRKDPFLVGSTFHLMVEDLAKQRLDLGGIGKGDVVALVGDFDAESLAALLELIDRNTVVVPLTADTVYEHDYFCEVAQVDVLININGRQIRRLRRQRGTHPLLASLREAGHPGLVLFSSGTTGRPKAILHDFTRFLARYRTPRPTFRTLNFLLFDHIGGINSLFHTLFNAGQVVAPSSRTPRAVVDDIARHHIELLPTTPTFLRLALLDGSLDSASLSSLKVITYGTERMDAATLERLCRTLPAVDFRQTYGMSELGILRVKSRSRDSLWMRVGGEGVETRVVGGALQIWAENRMLGYLNAPTPFDAEGWYDTGDLVEQDGSHIKIIGRSKEIINVGGIKVLPSELERVALLHPAVARAKAQGVANPITGQHIEITCQVSEGTPLDRAELRAHFRQHLPPQVCPHAIRIGPVAISHRFKQF